MCNNSSKCFCRLRTVVGVEVKENSNNKNSSEASLRSCKVFENFPHSCN